MICWDGGAPAAKALAEALPLLARAEKIEIVCVKDEELPGRPSGLEILRHLERHGVVGVLWSFLRRETKARRFCRMRPKAASTSS